MKLYITLLIFVFTVALLPLKAQSVDYKFQDKQTYGTYTKNLVADTITGVEEVGKIFELKKIFDYNYLIQVSADSVSQDSTVYFLLYGSVDALKFYPIDTVTWYESTADTSVLFQSSSAVSWPYLKPAIMGTDTATKARLKEIYFSISGSSQ